MNFPSCPFLFSLFLFLASVVTVVLRLSVVKESETHKLWRNIEPHLKKAMQTVYLREVSRSDHHATLI